LKEELEIVKEICGEHQSLRFDSGIGGRNETVSGRRGMEFASPSR